MAIRADTFREKTNQARVFDYMVRFEKRHTEQTGVKGVYPTAWMLREVFGISRQRATFYRMMFERKLNITLRAKSKDKLK